MKPTDDFSLGKITRNLASEFLYRQHVEQLEEALNDSTICPEATDALRTLIDRIVLYPGERRGDVRAELYGELGAILALSQGGGKTNRTPEAGWICSRTYQVGAEKIRLRVVAGAPHWGQ